jgi:hypothetical protein
VDNEHRGIGVEHVDDLQKPSSASAALDRELVFADLLRKRWPGLPDNEFRFFPVHAMFGKVIAVPANLPKLHDRLLPAIVAGKGAPGEAARQQPDGQNLGAEPIRPPRRPSSDH